MVWQYILTIISAVLLFGFAALCVYKFGWKTCYSAYGKFWDKGDINTWSLVTILSAFIIVPAILEASNNSPYQFVGFLAPVSLLLVGATPNYATDKTQAIIHPIGALSAVVFIVLYSILVPHLLWIVLSIVAIAALVGYIQRINGRKTIIFWLEMAMYMSTYVILFIII